MKKIYKKYFITIALIWAGCFVLFLFVYMIVLAPQKNTKKQVEKQFAEKKQLYDSVLKTTHEETKTELNRQIEYSRNRLNDFVINFEDSANLTFDISQIATEQKVGSFSIKGKNEDGYESIPNCDNIRESRISVSFTANFNQFAAFLNALETHRPVVFVDKFSITRSEKGDSEHQVNMNLAVFVRNRQDTKKPL